MSGILLSAAAILALAVNPQCGGAAPGSEFAQRLTAIAIHESSGNSLALGVNNDPFRKLPGGPVRSATVQQAVAQAHALIAQGRNVDLGLLQINSSQLTRHGLTVETAFDPCLSMRAGADHYADDVKAAVIFNQAARRYNTGSLERGAGYAASVESVLTRVRTADAVPVESSIPPPPGWDVWDQADHRTGPINGEPSHQAMPPAGRSQTAPVVMLHGLVAEKD